MTRKIKTKPKTKTLKAKAKVKPKTKKQVTLKKPRKKKTTTLENIDIGKLMRKHAYVEIIDPDKKTIKKEYLNISPSAVKEYILRITDATEINMRLIAERVYLGHNRKTIMVKHNKDRDDIDDITDHFGERKSKIIDGDKEGVLQ